MNCIKKKDTSQEYHLADHIGKSQLIYAKKSPEIFKYHLENPSIENETLIFGQAFHCYCLEPDIFDLNFIVLPECDRRTKEGKQLYSDFLEGSKGKQIISSSDFEKIKGMTDSAMSNKYARYFLTGGEVEQSYYWIDETTGEKVKCRPDLRKEGKTGNFIVDLKSCQSAYYSDFERDISKYGYHLQAAQYRIGVEEYEGKPHHFIFVAVEKIPPYAVNVIDIDDVFYGNESASNIGLDLYRALLGAVAQCRFTGDWFGYCGDDIFPTVSANILKEVE